MPRRWSGVLIFLLVFVSSMQAQGEPVLLSVGSDSVSRHEFEYYFHRSAATDAKQFLSSFIDFRIKVAHAKELCLDTFPTYRMQCQYYMQALRPKQGDKRGRLILHPDEEWIKLRHITYRLPQHIDRSVEQKARVDMDSTYIGLRDNVSMFMETSEELPWMPVRLLLEEWTEQLKGLARKEVSKPFYSPLGIHLILWEDKRVQGTSDDRQPVSDEETLAWQEKEMKDALLVHLLETEYASPDIACTEEDLKVYFDSHREDYAWNLPHYRGMVVHSRTSKEAKAIRKLLKRLPPEEWEDALKKAMDSSAFDCRMEYGLFQIGTNVYVDKLAFKCGDFEPLPDYPFTFVMGKKLKKGPDSYRDVREKVWTDYQNEQFAVWKDALKQKYKVEINEEVLKTVNNSGSN